MSEVRAPGMGALKAMVLASLRELGGSGSIAQIHEAVSSSPVITREQVMILHGAGPGTEIQYRTRWALVDLRHQGLVERVAPRAWRLTSRVPNTRPEVP